MPRGDLSGRAAHRQKLLAPLPAHRFTVEQAQLGQRIVLAIAYRKG